VRLAAFGPGGLLATADDGGGVRVWDVRTGAPVTPVWRPPAARAPDGEVRPVQVAFADEGRRLLTFSGGRAWSWDLAPDDRPADGLVRLARLLSGRRVDAFGGLAAAENAELARDWEELRARHPAAFALTPDELLAWHRAEAEACAAAGDWSPAAFHWGRRLAADADDVHARLERGRALVELGLPDLALADFSRALDVRRDAEALTRRGLALARLGRHADAAADFTAALALDDRHLPARRGRAEAHAELGRWADAAADFARATELGDDADATWYCLALARLAAEDLAGYASVGLRFLRRFERSGAESDARWAAWLCSLSPEGLTWVLVNRLPAGQFPGDTKEVLERLLAKTSVFALTVQEIEDLSRRAPEAGSVRWRVLTTSAALRHRMRRFQEVVQVLSEGKKVLLDGGGAAGRPPFAEMPGRMKRVLGLTDDAREWLLLAMACHELKQSEKARTWLDTAVRWSDAEAAKLPWHERLELQLLRREAEDLLAGKPPAGGEPS
jgi:tetratricopeptide (TPR) repeat protein